MIMFTLDASVMSMSTRKSSSRRLGLLVTIGIAAATAITSRTNGRNGTRTLITAGGVPSRARPQEARRPQLQHDEEDQVLEDRYPGHGNEDGEHALEQPDDESPDERTRRVPEPTEDDDDETLELVRPPGEDREREERREQRATRHREGRADTEREGEHAARVDPHELGRGTVVRHGADLLADARAEEEAVERR